MESIDHSRMLFPVLVFAVCAILLIISVILKKKVVKKHGLSDVVLRHMRAPIRGFIIFTLLYFVFEVLQYRWVFYPVIERIYSILVTLCFGWLTIKILNMISSLLLSYYDIQAADNYRARQVHTQVKLLRRLTTALVVFFVIIGILMTFDAVRAQGMKLLASAGILSIIVGLAAQKTIGNFFSGIQIVLSQPIHIDDVVLVENEWGRIEEIHLTFIVVKLWDLRRLIVPISYFTDRVFQNWTQKTANMLGAVMLYVDYSMPIAVLREELNQWIEGNSLWDGNVKVIQVTNATEKTIEIRILTSSPNSGASFDLRCAIREHFISFIQTKYPNALPRIRAEILESPRHEDLSQLHNPPKDPIRAPAPTLDPHPKPMEIKDSTNPNLK